MAVSAHPAAPPAPPADWHARSAAEALDRFDSTPAGLSPAEAAARRSRFGLNRLPPPPRRSPVALFFSQFKDFMIAVLLAAAVVAAVLGDHGDAAAILAIVVLNAAVGFAQEFRAERALEALRAIDAPQAAVERGGRRAWLNVEEVVPGDVVHLEAGGRVPADLRLFEIAALRIDESALTGESGAVDKAVEPLPPATALADRANMAYRGTLVAHGRGRGLAVATGASTELGRIAALLAGARRSPTPLERRLAVFGRRLAVIALALCALVFAAGLARGEPPLLMFLTAVSLAVAAIPEALPAVCTLALALGAQKMVRARALVRRLAAVETLGSVTVIATDKTGTLTENRMRVEAFHWGGERRAALSDDPGAGELARAMLLCNDARPGGDGRALGDPTETALFEAARAAGATPAERAGELPFDAGRKRMTTFHAEPGGAVTAYTKGAAEGVLSRCDALWTPAGAAPLPRDALRAAADAMASEGLRVLGFARREWPSAPSADAETAERGLAFLGFVGLLDPPRPDAAAAVALCLRAGVRPVMITGDHPLTARAVASRLGFPEGDLVTGDALASWDERARRDRVPAASVFARVSPEQKLDIVSALRAHGDVVAMTGDGVNDAPALRSADIGVAMGRSGTDAAKEAASLLLLDDNFSTIVGAVREGRRIFDNIRLFVKYVVTTNAAEILILFLAPFFGLPLPLLPAQILWINLLTDGLPGLALVSEGADPRVMDRPPRPPSEPLVTRAMTLHVLWVGALMTALVLGAQAAFLAAGFPHWRTAVFTVVCLSQLGHVLALRSERESFFSRRGVSNATLLTAVGVTVALQAAAVYGRPLGRWLQTEPLSAVEFAAAFAASAVVFAAVEVEKWIKRRFVRA